MRVAFPTLGVLLLAAALAACGKPAPQGEAGGKQTLTIQNAEAPPPPLPKASGGKLAVMDNPPPVASGPMEAPPVKPPAAAAGPDSDDNHYASDPHPDRADPRAQDPGYGADMADNDGPAMSRGDCLRAERFGDPAAGSGDVVQRYMTWAPENEV